MSKEQNGKVWSELVQLKLQANGGLLFTRLHGVARRQGHSLDTGLLSAGEVR